MKTYIQDLETKLQNSSCSEEQFEIFKLLSKEKERAISILDIYEEKLREYPECKKCEGAIEHEMEIIKSIDNIIK